MEVHEVTTISVKLYFLTKQNSTSQKLWTGITVEFSGLVNQTIQNMKQMVLWWVCAEHSQAKKGEVRFCPQEGVNSNVYLKMLDIYTFPQLQGSDMIWCTLHFGNVVGNQGMPSFRMGRGGSTSWPSRSPDLGLLDFSSNVPSLQLLGERISEPAFIVIRNALECTWQQLNYRLDICRCTNGRNVPKVEALHCCSQVVIWFRVPYYRIQ